MTQPLKIIFAGTPDFAAAHLQTLINSEHQVIAAYSQPDRPAGRGKKLTASPVKKLALEHDIPVYQPLNFKDPSDVQTLAELNADIMVVVAYGLLLPKSVLEAPRLGCINVHGSILPRWRGAAPIQRAIEAGDKTTGITIMQMDVGLDTGDMLVKAECPITSETTTASLHDELIDLGGPALIEALEQLSGGTAQPEVQDDSLSNYAKKIQKSEALIDWSLPASTLDLNIRAFNPFPVCYTELDNERVKIWQASIVEQSGNPGEIIGHDQHTIIIACGESALAIKTLQLPGKKAMTAADVLRGSGEKFSPGKTFSSSQVGAK